MSLNRPKIAVSLGRKQKSEFSRFPHVALRDSMFDAIWQCGGLPIAVPHIAEAIDDYLAEVDGVLNSDGSYRFREDWYDKSAPAKFTTDTVRGPFDITFTEKALAKDLPMLGVCCGMQLMAGVNGTTFYVDVMQDLPTQIDHLAPPAEEFAHKANIVAGTKLHNIIGEATIEVNTSHREAVKTVPTGVVVNAYAEDGVIEGVELPSHKFAIGVQWHPEFFLEAGSPHRKLFEALIAAAKA